MSDAVGFIVAAGAGRRFGGDLPKVFVPLAGSPLLLWSLRAYDSCPAITRLLVAVGPGYSDTAADLCRAARLRKPLEIITGGERRQDTVFVGLQHLSGRPPDIIAVHDGARPLTDADTIARSVMLAAEHGACVTAAPVTDTIKHAAADGFVANTPDRRTLWAAQTPQTFRFQLLLECYRRALAEGWEVTDDASVVERCGQPVRINPGGATNIKVTTVDDLRHAESILGVREGWEGSRSADRSYRVGVGYDAHALVPGRPLILGGVHVPHPTGLAGHSDADVLIHAVCDALLGAAVAGDIGLLFPDSDPAFSGIDSALLLQRVAEHVRALGHGIANVDATIIAQRPKLSLFIPQMRTNLAAALGVPLSAVSVKATTTEGLGFEGREEGIAAQAVALLTCAGG